MLREIVHCLPHTCTRLGTLKNYHLLQISIKQTQDALHLKSKDLGSRWTQGLAGWTWSACFHTVKFSLSPLFGKALCIWDASTCFGEWGEVCGCKEPHLTNVKSCHCRQTCLVADRQATYLPGHLLLCFLTTRVSFLPNLIAQTASFSST